MDQQPTTAVVREFQVSDTQHQGLLRLQRREGDGRQEGPHYETVLRLLGGPVQDRNALPIGQMKRFGANNCGHG
ncbi:hypothetical protein [Streptomyces sviceus]|uniref:hypothetical protein n=1 Tax=Streptomyces sviceus TaxID=285530 RepID=UPI0036CE2A32